MFLMFPTIGYILSKVNFKMNKRDFLSLTNVHKITQINPNLSEPVSDDYILKLAADSSLFYQQNLPILQRAIDYKNSQRYMETCILTLPLLESSLRRLYVQANNCPQRLVTAETTSLYTTFTEMVMEESLLQGVMGRDLLLLLFDLLVLPGGPRVRDRLSHGEVKLSGTEDNDALQTTSHLLLIALGCVLCKVEQGSLSTDLENFLDGYEAVFHPAARLARDILLYLDQVQDISRIPAPNDFEFNKTSLNPFMEDMLKDYLEVTSFEELRVKIHSHP